MQVKKFPSTQKSLSQGTIFTFKKLKFKKIDGNGTLSFAEMYPEAKLTNVNYGIVLSQTCDLVNEGSRKIETPYVITALLDPIERYFEEHYQEKVTKTVSDNTFDFPVDENENRKFLNKQVIIDKVTKDLERFFLNNEKFFFFVSIKDKTKTELYTINLTKMFPIKAAHCEELLKKAEYQLKPFFENKLGWKLAEVYGRVGTPDYKQSELKELTEILLNKVSSKVNFGQGIPISNDDFGKAKNLAKAKKEKRDAFLIEIMSKI